MQMAHDRWRARERACDIEVERFVQQPDPGDLTAT